jgi:hypothetical protein
MRAGCELSDHGARDAPNLPGEICGCLRNLANAEIAPDRGWMKRVILTDPLRPVVTGRSGVINRKLSQQCGTDNP